MYPNLRKPWEKWYLQAVQTKNMLIDVALKDADKDHVVFENKDVWKIYLAMDYGDGIFRSSNIVSFDKENMSIKTKRGSIYQLGEPYNEKQLGNLENYFEE